MATDSKDQRVAFSPGEFAALFGKSQTWGYRQIYAGKVKTLTEYGRILIPAKEVERMLASAGIYNGMEKPKAQKARLQKLPEREQNAWQRFIDSRKPKAGRSKLPVRTSGKGKPGKIPDRIVKSWKGKSAKS